jgi:hypothetical protein
MRINELLVENQTDEGIASAIGKGIGAVSKGVGAIPGAVHGAWDKFKQGYQAGRSGVSGTGSQSTGGGTTSGSTSDSGNVSQSGSGGVTTPYVNTTQQSNTSQPASTTSPSQPATDPKVIQTSIQHLKGADVERIRGMLKKRAGISESQIDEISIGAIAQGAKNLAGKTGTALKTAGQAVKGAYNAAAPVVKKAAQATGQAIKAVPGAVGSAAGAVRGAVTTARGAYQQAKGGTMTAQELDHAIATMSAAQAGEMLQFFNTIHPETAAATTPAASGVANQGHPADDNPNINLGYNESVGYSRFLKMEI